MERPAGVTATGLVTFLAAGYLCALGLIMLARPGLISMTNGAPLLHGLELAGPYMFLLVAAAGLAIGIGLWRMHNWARRLTIILAFVGIVMLIPSVSGSMLTMNVSTLVRGGLGIITRVVIVWYLYQTPVAEQFLK